MFCPKCGHNAVSGNLRYCPGCGFWLQGVAELVANDRHFPADGETAPKPRRSMVKRGALLGATLMFISVLVIVPARINSNSAMNDLLALFFTYWIALMAIIGISGYVKRLAAKIFSEEEPSPSNKNESTRSFAAPAAQFAPVSDSGRILVDTNRMGERSSVAEQTTSRLNKL